MSGDRVGVEVWGSPCCPWPQHQLPCAPRYVVGHDPAGWLAVHPETGLVTAQDHLDRESPFVKNSTYMAMLLAVDDGEGHERALVPPPA